uniref:Uncharacterized protein n=1 Tax=Rhizophora mucronata TaxID=61149 RepID=A0A2P2PLW0_RHIMU
MFCLALYMFYFYISAYHILCTVHYSNIHCLPIFQLKYTSITLQYHNYPK